MINLARLRPDSDRLFMLVPDSRSGKAGLYYSDQTSCSIAGFKAPTAD